MKKLNVLGSSIEEISLDQAVNKVSSWASRRESRTVIFCNVHSVVTAQQDEDFHSVIARADLVAPDGAPIAWLMRFLGAKGQERISGPDFMWSYMSHAERAGQSIFLYGGTEKTLVYLRKRLQLFFPRLCIAGCISPPFRPLTPDENRHIIEAIRRSGAETVWVSLGCPKQERWMDVHRKHLKVVMLGVGAAFEFHAGTLKRAPKWMQRSGLEWAYRLSQQPKTLWRRYLVTNTLFLLGVLRELLAHTLDSN